MLKSTHLVATKTSLMGKFSCLLNCHLPIWSGLPLLQSNKGHVMGWWQSFCFFKENLSLMECYASDTGFLRLFLQLQIFIRECCGQHCKLNRWIKRIVNSVLVFLEVGVYMLYPGFPCTALRISLPFANQPLRSVSTSSKQWKFHLS